MISDWELPENYNVTLPENTTIIFPHVWGYTDESADITEAKDIILQTLVPMSVKEAIELLEEEALAYLKTQGASELRTYYIEGIKLSINKMVVIWGS